MRKIKKETFIFLLIGILGGALCLSTIILPVEDILRLPIVLIPFLFLAGFLIYAILFKKRWKIFFAYSVGLICSIALILLVSYSYAEIKWQYQDKIVWKFTPNLDSASTTGIYIPENIDECHHELDETLSFLLKREMKNRNSDEMNMYHFSMGQWIRNYWGLWGGSRLSEYMKSLGYTHPDDMSGAILATYWCHLHNCDYDLNADIEWNKEFYKNQVKMIKVPRPSICKCQKMP